MDKVREGCYDLTKLRSAARPPVVRILSAIALRCVAADAVYVVLRTTSQDSDSSPNVALDLVDGVFPLTSEICYILLSNKLSILPRYQSYT